MPKSKMNHTHLYYKAYPFSPGLGVFKGRHVWTCGLPDCSHYLPGNVPEPVGKMSICWKCDGKFLLDVENMIPDKPICDRCSNPNYEVPPDDFDWERAEAKSFIVKMTGKAFDEVTEEEIDRMVQLRRLRLLDK